jgi:hypothetical protein
MEWQHSSFYFNPVCKFNPEKEHRKRLRFYLDWREHPVKRIREVWRERQREFSSHGLKCHICGETAACFCINCREPACEKHAPLFTSVRGEVAPVCTQCVEDNKSLLAFNIDFPFETRFNEWMRSRGEPAPSDGICLPDYVRKVKGAHVVEDRKSDRDLVYEKLAGLICEHKCEVCGEPAYAPPNLSKVVHRRCFDATLRGLDEDSKELIRKGGWV